MSDKKFKINNSYDSPTRLDFSIAGLHKKRVITIGELRTVEYYKNYDGAVYSDLVIRENRTYTRNELGLVQYRTLFIEWFLNDGTIGTTTTSTKYYSATESIDEGIERRRNIIAAAKMYCLDTLGQANSFDLLSVMKPYIDVYVEGYKQPLISAVTASSKPYLTSEIKDAIILILTF